MKKRRKSAQQLYKEAWRVARMGERHYYIRRPYGMPFYWKAVQSHIERSEIRPSVWCNAMRQTEWRIAMIHRYPHLVVYGAKEIPF